MAIEVFNRYENKYMLDWNTFERLQLRLAEYMEPDAYNKEHETYTISNLYYDTPDNQMIRSSLMKPKYKEKLRLRAYGVPEMHSKVYVEIKKKCNSLVNKRRSALTLGEAYSFLNTSALPEPHSWQNRQVLREIQYILQSYELEPALYLAYDRRAYFGTGDHDLRVSFDHNIRTRRRELLLECGDYGRPLLEAGQWLMEIKSAQSIPVWLCRILSEYKIFPTSFSKYGTEYKQLLQSQELQPRVCWYGMDKKPSVAAAVINPRIERRAIHV